MKTDEELGDIGALAACRKTEVIPLQVDNIESRYTSHNGPAGRTAFASDDRSTTAIKRVTAGLMDELSRVSKKYQQELERAQKAEGDSFFLRETLSRIRALPEKWREHKDYPADAYVHAVKACANELAALLGLDPSKRVVSEGVANPTLFATAPKNVQCEPESVWTELGVEDVHGAWKRR